MFAEAFDRRFNRVRYEGDFRSWAEARAASTGYDSTEILERVCAAAREVQAGRAAYERDGVAFAEPAVVWPVIAGLLRAAAKTQGSLRVLDFGGSLGSLYFQHRTLLRGFREVRWAVVEQPMFVSAGRAEFTTDELSFHADLASAVRDCAPTVALLSGVINWIEEPHAILDAIARERFDSVLMDRTALTRGARDRLAVQVVPARIGRASYPTWLLTRDGIVRHFAADYDLLAEFPAQDTATADAEFRGFCFERRP